MSARNNLIVPQGFSDHQADRVASPHLFTRLTNSEARKLLAAGKIMAVGTTGRTWKVVVASMTHDFKSAGRALLAGDPRGAGRVAVLGRTESDRKRMAFIANEMALRPSWDLA